MKRLPVHPRVSMLAATWLITAAGGALDAWVYVAHGHVFANAQTGNIVLMALAFSQGDLADALKHLPSLAAFIVGLLTSRLGGAALKRSRMNSRVVRLGAECVLLLMLAVSADRLSNHVVTACVGFIAGLQITSLSHIGGWSFNTGMTTGNLRATAKALSNALNGAAQEWPHAIVLATVCIAFAGGAVLGAWLTPRLAGLTLVPVAALVAAAAASAARERDPFPDWTDSG